MLFLFANLLEMLLEDHEALNNFIALKLLNHEANKLAGKIL